MDDLNRPKDRPETRLGRGLTPPPSWRRWAWAVLGVVAVLAAVWWVWGRNPPAAPAGRYAMGGPLPVAAASAKKSDIDITLNALGTVTPLATVTVRTQIAGQLMQVNFDEGQMVKKGDLLAVVDPRPYENQLEQAEGQLAHDRALQKNAEIDLVRYRTLAAQDSIAKQQVDTQESLVKQYDGTVKSDQAQIDTAKLNLAYCHIVAPVSGRVGLRQVDQGNYVQTGDTNGIVVITQLQPITVVFTLPEDALPAVLQRLQAGATLPAVAWDRSLTTKLAEGKLLTVDNQIDTSTGTLKLKAQFDNTNGTLFPNQFVNIQLLVDTLHDVIAIPAAAIQHGAPGDYVYLIKPDNSVAVQPVTLGATDGALIEVRQGLNPGDQVVTDGTDKLRDGAKIQLRDANAAPPGKGGAGSPDAQKHHSRAAPAGGP